MSATPKTCSIATLKPYKGGFGGGKPEAGDLAVVRDGTIVMFAKGKGKGCKAAQGLVRLNAHSGELVTLVD